jgi:hypothetical protein
MSGGFGAWSCCSSTWVALPFEYVDSMLWNFLKRRFGGCLVEGNKCVLPYER